MRQVFQARNPTEAHLAKGILEVEGIVAEIRGEALFGARGAGPMDMLPTVWVLDEEADRARELLRDLYNPSGEHETGGESWTCPTCGESLEAQFTSCWSCGTEKPA